MEKALRATSLLPLIDRNLSRAGLVVGVILFCLSLTPSLLPRTPPIQGLLSGTTFAFGYAIGATLQWLWDYIELGRPFGAYTRLVSFLVAVLCAALVLYSLVQIVPWQNSVRAAMGEPPVHRGHPFQVVLVALLPAVVLVTLGTLLVHSVQAVARRMKRYVPRRVALLLGITFVSVVTAVLFNGVLLRFALASADRFFEQLDQVAGQFGEPPANTLQSGSAASLVAWNTIGRDGRVYVQSGPSQSAIAAMIGRPAEQPLRVYVGLRSAATLEERARLALEEMLRVGAFDRSVLVVIMPVGTGWVDPPSIDSLEYLMAGDVASVALQYSYLTSPLSLVVQPEYGTEAAQALFSIVYQYWTKLPRDTRPRLYLNGLSLGANSSQASAQILDLFADPYNGALWAGPPFTSSIWGYATANRDPGSPEWRPRFGNASTVRFANRGAELGDPGTPWGPLRIAFLQYPSDPIVFFEWSSYRTEPAWMIGQRGPGVSSALTWYPLVTWLQLGMDMALAQTSPIGYGHNYAIDDYIDAWRALVDPRGWNDASIAELKERMASYPAGKP
ncbi:alpha/beta-hydrolase family protein [Devosia sp. 1566]|uniref:alpha/beta hydrolase n=1 Tax=Devosia sp. 1566 TaxID=2499144 RepID=UPI000FD94451|nr:alpha/beta-hydrolase family protein [Devosia sp. 1566]